MNPMILLDLDGTLIDSASICAAIAGAMRASRGFGPASVDRARSLVSHGAEALVRGLLAEAAAHSDDDLAEFRAQYASLPTPADSLFPGVRDGLDRIAARGIAMAICSNKPQNLCDKIVDDLDLRGYFSAVVGASSALPCKPAPHMALHAIRTGGGESRRCAYIGDSDVDYWTARNAGIPVVLVTYGYSTPLPVSAKPPMANSFADAVTHALLLLKTGGAPTPSDPSHLGTNDIYIESHSPYPDRKHS